MTIRSRWLNCFALITTSVAVLVGTALIPAADQPAVKTNAADAAVDPAHAKDRAAGLELFRKEVRQVLVGRCVKCHGGEKVEGKFDLTTREALLKGGETGVVAIVGKSQESLLMKLIKQEEEPHMPADGAKLSDLHIAAIGRWIDLGAPYDKSLKDDIKDPKAWIHREITPDDRSFWAFQPLKVVAPPSVDGDVAKWSRSPIDQFVSAKLKEKGLTPNPVVDRRTLIRRAYFDLIGLPPEPVDIESFANDPTPNAFEKVIDKLLASPHYGERWGRHWLDVARFAESHGFEQDYDRPFAYYFRDFVIQAFNQDMPYDQFVKWQLAGDEFAPDAPLAQMATGFLGAGVFPTQITANEVERTRYDALDDMTSTTTGAFLGLTVGCARCHDHKFDPFPAADYYRLTATFTTTVRSEVDLDLDPATYKKEKAAFDLVHAPIADALAKFENESLAKRFADWEKAEAALRAEGKSQIKAKWMILDVAEMKSAGGATLTKQEDGSILATGTNPDFETYTFTAKTDVNGITAIRLEALAHPSMVKSGPGRADNGNIDLTDFKVTLAPKAIAGQAPAVPKEIKLINAIATYEQGPHLAVKLAIDGDKKSGWALDPKFGQDHAAVFEPEAPIGAAAGSVLTITLTFNGNNRHNIGRPRLSITTASGPISLDGDAQTAGIPELLAMAADKRSPEQNKTLLNWFKYLDADWKKLNQAAQESLSKAPKPKLVKVMVCSEGVKPIRHHTQGADFFEQTHFLHRGDTVQKVDVAAQGFLQVLMNSPEREKTWIETPPAGSKTSYRRRSLANWLTDTQRGPGHLLARVMANRLWQHHFHVGIVGTPNDFGAMGQRPTHPELLDWLAATLMAPTKVGTPGGSINPDAGAGWKLKAMHKLIMLSATYQQSTAFDANKSKIDPQNQFHWRRSPRRLEAEVIRDAMLAVSGSLDATMFGAGTLEESHKRRSIYFMVKRSRLIPMMQLFDSPEPLVSVGERPSTTIAPQALMFLNNPNVRSYAQNLGKRLLPAADKSLADAVKQGYLSAVGRLPTSDEQAETVTFLEQQTASYQTTGKANARELALADFAQVLMSLNDFVYLD